MYDTALTTMLGPQWNKVPVREMMVLLNKRFGGVPVNYDDKEVAPIIHLMKDCVQDLSPDQVKFLEENDHLPISKREGGGVWMDSDELVAYARDHEDDVHKRKMDYFITMNGILAAYQQGVGHTQRSPRKPFKFSMVHMFIIAVIVVGLIVMVVL